TIIGEWDAAMQPEHDIEGLDLPPGPAVSHAENLAFLAALRGEPERAWAVLAAVEPVRASIEDARAEGARLLLESQMLALEGRLGAAYETAMEGASRTDPYVFPNSLWAARVALWRGDREGAKAPLEINLAIPVQGRFVDANRLVLEAGVRAIGGETDGALAAYRECLRHFQALEMPFPRSMALMEAGTLLDPAIPAVAAYAAEARAQIERLGSPPLLARLDAMLEARAASAGSSAEGTIRRR
ncbi:MAG TPA: hypothetical protein VG518_03035, partial [Solirubrobacterales bacterium]|nr:hypothetical protein [Solirubrobacterales bacterium]